MVPFRETLVWTDHSFNRGSADADSEGPPPPPPGALPQLSAGAGAVGPAGASVRVGAGAVGPAGAARGGSGGAQQQRQRQQRNGVEPPSSEGRDAFSGAEAGQIVVSAAGGTVRLLLRAVPLPLPIIRVLEACSSTQTWPSLRDNSYLENCIGIFPQKRNMSWEQ